MWQQAQTGLQLNHSVMSAAGAPPTPLSVDFRTSNQSITASVPTLAIMNAPTGTITQSNHPAHTPNESITAASQKEETR